MEFKTTEVTSKLSVEKKPTAIVHQETNTDFKITANHDGVVLSGSSPPIISMHDLDVFAKELSKAWKNFDRTYRKKIQLQ